MKVVAVNFDHLLFQNGYKLSSFHAPDCCEEHYLNWEDLDMRDFEGLEFDLSSDNFFRRIKGYGIELVAINGQRVQVAGHGSNNGYYSEALDLVLTGPNGFERRYDVSECQTIEG